MNIEIREIDPLRKNAVGWDGTAGLPPQYFPASNLSCGRF
jgi:hypothetical protein